MVVWRHGGVEGNGVSREEQGKRQRQGKVPQQCENNTVSRTSCPRQAQVFLNSWLVAHVVQGWLLEELTLFWAGRRRASERFKLDFSCVEVGGTKTSRPFFPESLRKCGVWTLCVDCGKQTRTCHRSEQIVQSATHPDPPISAHFEILILIIK